MKCLPSILVLLGRRPNREGLGGFHPCPLGEPLQVVKGWGVQSLSFWGAVQIVKGWGGPILVFLGTAPFREGLGGATPFLKGNSEIGRQPM